MGKTKAKLDLSTIAAEWHDDFMDAFWDDSPPDHFSFLTHFCDGNFNKQLRFLFTNHAAFLSRGIYERELALIYINSNANFWDWKTAELKKLFYVADKKRLLASGDALPPGDSFKLYRGVSGKLGVRRVGGMSWTDSKEVAEKFATEFPMYGGINQAIYTTLARREEILLFTDGQDEREFILWTKRYRRTNWQPD